MLDAADTVLPAVRFCWTRGTAACGKKPHQCHLGAWLKIIITL